MNIASRPDRWTPTETTVSVPEVGDVTCVAVFDHSEDEGGRKEFHNDSMGGHWEMNQRTHWTVTVTFEGHSISSPYSQGSAFDKPPTAEYVLGSLAMDASCPETFEDFCAEYGYDSDSRSAEKTWGLCRDIELQMRRMFGGKFETVQKWGWDQ